MMLLFKRLFLLFCLLFVSCFLSSSLFAQEPYATISIDKDSVTVGERFFTTITVFYPHDYMLEEPYPLPVMSGLITHGLDHQSRISDNTVVHDVFTVECALFSIGEHTLSVSSVRLAKQGESEKIIASTASATVVVRSVLPAEVEKTNLVDIKGIVKAKSLAYYRIPLLLIMLIGGFALFGFTWYQKRVRNEEVLALDEDLSVHDQAYSRLEGLQNSDLLKDGRVKEFYSQLALILRAYISARFTITVEEKTSSEILSVMQSFSMEDSVAANCKYALQECDMVKFAKFRPTVENIKQCFLAVKHFIDETKIENNEV